MMLKPLVPDSIWHAQQPLKFGPLAISSRMTVVRLADGALWVHSPITPTAELTAALKALGPVRYVVAPNKGHHLFFLPFLQAFPEARGFIAPGLSAKRVDLKPFPVLGTAGVPDWSPELQDIYIEGLPILNETAWFHAPSGTLIVADILTCFGEHNGFLLRAAARLLGVYQRLGVSRTMRALVKDRAALSRSVARLLALDIRRVVLAHDQIVEVEAKAKLERAFAWLRR